MDMNDDRNMNLSTKILPPSSIHHVEPSKYSYTKKFNDVYNESLPPSQSQSHYEVFYEMISKQSYSGQGLGKMEQIIKVPIEPSSQCTREGVVFPPSFHINCYTKT